ncbi:fatty acid desaturase [Aspergillus saccharolyticus JOP 1030-1]|uniref:Delta 8-(E)-sphingolipid desaturase n=1 Tax=Aspergillus saccharolyticus JOP 1030-1 TaxID=1450539 RepID=A0A319A8R4_9EURO|nr:fatty acid/sphingolipid desaturase [Aspergillus saccharolyticus JOP 1030-1]PYH48078.1 fatty acid/sphingolipid desaturase [Aspergillus saccharolyticus JOP 1030-1]
MGTSSNASSGKEQIFSVQQIEDLIVKGQAIVIIDQKVLRVDAWLPYHPGGYKPIQHFIGKDATDEFVVMHSAETRQLIDRYQIGRIEGRWRNLVPPIQRDPEHGHTKNTKSGPNSPINYHEQDHHLPELPQLSSDRNTPEELAFLNAQTKEEIRLTLDRYPSLDAPTQSTIIERYRRLHAQIQAEGLYQCNYSAYAWEFGRCALLFCIMLVFLRLEWYCTSAVFLGWFWSQMVFAAHDSAHMAITHDFLLDNLLGMIIAAPIGGLSLGWWKRTHNVHHLVTNSPAHDPDNQHLPFLAVNHRFLGSLFSSYHERLMPYTPLAQRLVPYQAYLYYIILMFGRFNLYVQSWIFLIQGQGPRKGPAWWHRYFEIAGNLLFWGWFGYGIVYRSLPTVGTRVMFVLLSHAVTMPLHVQFTLSHFAMSTADLGPAESFPQRMLRTTMDVDCPEWLDWVHGGLQFQAIHHLFPRVPRHNLRRVQQLVLAFCSEVDIPYALYGFVGGNRKVVGSLAEVGRQAAILAECRRVVAGRIASGDVH